MPVSHISRATLLIIPLLMSVASTSGIWGSVHCGSVVEGHRAQDEWARYIFRTPWASSTTTQVKISTCGSTSDTALTVFNGISSATSGYRFWCDDCGWNDCHNDPNGWRESKTLHLVASNPNNADQLAFDATYTIAVYGFFGRPGHFRLSVTCSPQPTAGSSVCIPASVSASPTPYATMTMPEAGVLLGVSFKYESGMMHLCSNGSAACTGRFGTSLGMYMWVTRNNSDPMYPASNTQGFSSGSASHPGSYQLAPFSANGDFLDLIEPIMYVQKGETLRIYNGDVLKGSGNNTGQTCARVQLLWGARTIGSEAPTPAPTPAPTTTLCTRITGMDLPCNDLSNAKQTGVSLEQCEASCNGRSDCKCYTFVGGNCWLKGGSCDCWTVKSIGGLHTSGLCNQGLAMTAKEQVVGRGKIYSQVFDESFHGDRSNWATVVIYFAVVVGVFAVIIKWKCGKNFHDNGEYVDLENSLVTESI